MISTNHLTAFAQAAQPRWGLAVRQGGQGLCTVPIAGATTLGAASQCRAVMPGSEYARGRVAASGDDR